MRGVLLGLLGLAVMACEPGYDYDYYYRDRPTAQGGPMAQAGPMGPAPEETPVVTASSLGITIKADPYAWTGDPANLPEFVTPVAITITNHGSSDVRISLSDFGLFDEKGSRYAAVSPYPRRDQRPYGDARDPVTPELALALHVDGEAPALVLAQHRGGGFHGGFRGGGHGGFRGGFGGHRGMAPRGGFGGRGYHGGPRFHGGARFQGGFRYHGGPRYYGGRIYSGRHLYGHYGYPRGYYGHPWRGSYHRHYWGRGFYVPRGLYFGPTIGFYAYPWFSFYYGGLYPVWPSGFAVPYDYWDHVRPWDVAGQQQPPSRDVMGMGLPQGVVKPGGQVSGFVYFQRPAADVRQLRLVWTAKAPDGQPVATLDAPLPPPR